MYRKIEPGCLAVLIGGNVPEQIGNVLTVGRFIGSLSDWAEADIWEVSPPIEVPMFTLTGESTGLRRTVGECPEKFLMRIDGHEETEEIEEAATA